jgi:predicted nucleic acid-binding protein
LSVPKIIVHSDVFVKHLCGEQHPSILRQAMSKFFCYITVFQAIDLFSMAKSTREYTAVEDSMSAMKILGLNARNAKRYGRLLAAAKGLERWNVLVAGLCLESRLPILTDRKHDFRGVKGLVVIPTRLVAKFESGEEIMKAARKA